MVIATAEQAKGREKKGKIERYAASRPPLTLLLQRDPATAKKTIFLFPDGSGSAMVYARLPRLGADTCLWGLNSPFLSVRSFSTTFEDFATVFAAAIRETQPHGPYNLGGWPAGSLFATEVARLMLHAGEAFASIMLIDSPCRLEYYPLPLEVVKFLAAHNLMGNRGSKATPQ